MTKDEKVITLESFIQREITLNQSALVEEALKTKLFSCEDIQNIYRPFDGLLLHPNRCRTCNRDYTCLDSETGLCEDCYEERKELQEICEWWLVSPWLSKKLLIAGAPILDNDYGVWWGRCTTGQAIMMDDVIQMIYDDLMN